MDTSMLWQRSWRQQLKIPWQHGSVAESWLTICSRAYRCIAKLGSVAQLATMAAGWLPALNNTMAASESAIAGSASQPSGGASACNGFFSVAWPGMAKAFSLIALQPGARFF